MNEEKDVVVTDTNEDMDLDLNLDDSDDVGALREENARLKEAKRQIHARALRAEKAIKERPINNEYTINDEVVDLRLDGYTKDEVAFILKNGGRKTLEDKNSYVSIAINARKEQARAEAEANKVVDTSGLSEVERKYTPDMMKNMSLDELKKIVPKA